MSVHRTKPLEELLLEDLKIEISRIFYVAILGIKQECRKIKFITQLENERWKYKNRSC